MSGSWQKHIHVHRQSPYEATHVYHYTSGGQSYSRWVHTRRSRRCDGWVGVADNNGYGLKVFAFFNFFDAFRQGMREHGYVDGQNVNKEKPPNARANAGGRRKPNPPPPLYVQTPPFGHGAGVGYGRRGITPTWAASREAAMIGVLNDLVLFSCLAAFVSGIAIAAATVII